MSDIDKQREDFKRFMDDYVAFMKVRHENDMREVRYGLIKIGFLLAVLLAYTFWLIPILEAYFFDIKK